MTTSPVDPLLAWSTGLVVFVFALAGLSKLGRGSSLLLAMEAMRVPSILLKRWIAECVPVLELAIAAALLVTDGALLSAAASAAALLLLVFTTILIGVLARGQEVDCGCFGGMSADARISRWSVVRNAALFVLTIFIGVTAPHSAGLIESLAFSDTLTRLELALAWSGTGLLALLGIVIGLRRKLERRALRRDGGTSAPRNGPSPTASGMGDPIPDAEVVSENGITTPLSRLGRGNPVLLLFLSAECSSCVRIAEKVPEWQSDLLPVKIRVITSSRRDVVLERFPTAAAFVRYGSMAARKALGVRREPAGVALGGVQLPVVASPVVYGTAQIQALIIAMQAKSDYSAPPGIEVEQ